MNRKTDDALLANVMERLCRKEMGIATASVLLGVTERQVYKIKKAWLSGPDPALEAPRARKSPPNKTDAAVAERIVELYRAKYKGFSYAHFHEKLSSEEGIEANLKTVERVLKRANLISPFATKKTKREAKRAIQATRKDGNQQSAQRPDDNDSIVFDAASIHNRHRRIEDFGALIQMDARTDYYVEGEKWTLHLAVDVASGVFVGAFFDKEETLWGYQNVLHQIVSTYGIPKCILSDNRTVFEYIRRGSDAESKNTLIQFKHSCIQLGIRLNTTSVATYKSIIERGNGTFGRRTPQELRLRGITGIDEANGFLADEHLAYMNGLFAKGFAGKNVFRPAPDEKTLCDCIGSVARRTFDKAACIRYGNRYYYAVIRGKIVAFAQGTKCLIVRTFDARTIIVVGSVSYAAVRIDEYEFSPEKQANPESENFIQQHRVEPAEFYNYKARNVSMWTYDSFCKYVEKELDLIELKH